MTSWRRREARGVARRYTRVATGMIAAVDSPLDDLRRGRRKRKKAGG